MDTFIFPVSFNEFQKQTNVREIAINYEKERKETVLIKAIRNLELCLYMCYYQDRTGYPQNLIKVKPTCDKIIKKRLLKSIHYPVSFKEFKQFTNVLEIAESKKFRNFERFALKIYQNYYTSPEFAKKTLLEFKPCSTTMLKKLKSLATFQNADEDDENENDESETNKPVIKQKRRDSNYVDSTTPENTPEENYNLSRTQHEGNEETINTVKENNIPLDSKNKKLDETTTASIPIKISSEIASTSLNTQTEITNLYCLKSNELSDEFLQQYARDYFDRNILNITKKLKEIVTKKNVGKEALVISPSIVDPTPFQPSSVASTVLPPTSVERTVLQSSTVKPTLLTSQSVNNSTPSTSTAKTPLVKTAKQKYLKLRPKTVNSNKIISNVKKDSSQSSIHPDHLLPQRVFFGVTDKFYKLSNHLNSTEISKQIAAAASSMNLKEFRYFTSIYGAPIDIYNNLDMLKRCYAFVIKNPKVWPINLFISLKDLFDFCKNKNIPYIRKDLKDISPKLLNPEELQSFTNFDECVYKGHDCNKHKMQNNYIKCSQHLNNKRHLFYQVCWTHNRWLDSCPNITDPIMLKKLDDSMKPIVKTETTKPTLNGLIFEQTPNEMDFKILEVNEEIINLNSEQINYSSKTLQQNQTNEDIQMSQTSADSLKVKNLDNLIKSVVKTEIVPPTLNGLLFQQTPNEMDFEILEAKEEIMHLDTSTNQQQQQISEDKKMLQPETSNEKVKNSVNPVAGTTNIRHHSVLSNIKTTEEYTPQEPSHGETCKPSWYQWYYEQKNSLDLKNHKRKVSSVPSKNDDKNEEKIFTNKVDKTPKKRKAVESVESFELNYKQIKDNYLNKQLNKS